MGTEKRKAGRKLRWTGIAFLAAFAVWTVAVRLVDVRPIGPNGSAVGFAAFNGAVHDTVGVHMTLYDLTDFLGMATLGFMPAFAVLGLVQWIRRRSLKKVDGNLLALGGFYIAVMAVYFLFERAVVNYRPVLIDGVLEASYPSSTTVLAICLIPTAMMQLHMRIRRTAVQMPLLLLLGALNAFLVVGRFFSGVHWTTDIIGGILIGTALVLLYVSVCKDLAAKEGTNTSRKAIRRPHS